MKTYKAYFEADEIRLYGSYLTKTIKAESVDEAKAKAEAIAQMLEDENGLYVDILDIEQITQ